MHTVYTRLCIGTGIAIVLGIGIRIGIVVGTRRGNDTHAHRD